MDTGLAVTSAIVQALVIILLIHKRIYRQFPLFSAYLVWVFAADLTAAFIANRMQPALYDRLYLISSIFDAVFLFSILVEMSMSVLKPVKSLLPRWTIVAVAGLIASIAFAAWHIASPPGIATLSKTSQYIIRSDITTSLLRIVFFVSLAALSHLLSLSWRDRVLQISTGLGFFSLVSLCVTFLHMNQGVGGDRLNDLYHLLDRIVAGSYIASLLYWLISFAQDVPERQEFTPQMRNFLTSMAQNAQSIRLAITSSEAKS